MQSFAEAILAFQCIKRKGTPRPNQKVNKKLYVFSSSTYFALDTHKGSSIIIN